MSIPYNYKATADDDFIRDVQARVDGASGFRRHEA
jgi:hypothetical protein